MVLVNSGFHTWENLSENYPQLGHTPLKILASLVLGQKSEKNIRLADCPIINLPGAPT